MSEHKTPLETYASGRELLEKGNIDGAIEWLLESSKQTPHHKTYELLGEAYAKKECFSNAVLYLAAATTLNPGPRAPSILAEIMFKRGNIEDARRLAELALSRDSKNKKAKSVIDAIPRNLEKD